MSRLTTDRITADTLVYTGNCVLYGIWMETDGTNVATLSVYDNTSAAGKMVRKVVVPGADYFGGFDAPAGILCANGIYADIAGTGAAAWVSYSPTLI